MKVGQSSTADGVIHRWELADPNVNLDLSSERWFLNDNQASVIVGRDVIRPGTLRKEGGRKPVGSVIPVEDRPIVSAVGVDLLGESEIRFSDVYQPDIVNPNYQRIDIIDGVAFAVPPRLVDTSVLDGSGSMRMIQKLKKPYAWPRAMIGGTWILDAAERYSDVTRSRIIDVVTATELNDTLVFSASVNALPNYNFDILYSAVTDKRGVWVSNGRKFWLLQGGQYTQYMDLGSDEYLGTIWDVSKIAINLIMFVSAKYPGRIIRLEDTGSTDVSTNNTMAGIIAPVKDTVAEAVELSVGKSWQMKATASEGSTTAGTCRIKVRGVNLETNAESQFVQVLAEDSDDDFLTLAANDGVSVWNKKNDSRFGTPPFHERWSHIEFWRTLSDGVSYFLEKRVPITGFPNESSVGPTTKLTPASPSSIYLVIRNDAGDPIWQLKDGASTGQLVYTFAVGDVVTFTYMGNTLSYQVTKESAGVLFLLPGYEFSGGGTIGGADDTNKLSAVVVKNHVFARDSLIAEAHYEGTYSDATLAVGTPFTTEDTVVGVQPPLCQQAISMGGVTVCMGKADADAEDGSADSRNFYSTNYSYSTFLKQIVLAGAFTDYDYQVGDTFEFITGGTANSALGKIAITGKVDADRITIDSDTPPLDPAFNSFYITGLIRRPYPLNIPKIASDEEAWYSRTDVLAPESFVIRSVIISRIGDIFRTMVIVGNYVAVIMDSGVHLLFLVKGSLGVPELLRDTVSATGDGTPWADSVIVVKNTVMWGSSEGIKIMSVSNDVNADGRRGSIQLLSDDPSTRQWFRDALDSGETIDSGLDTLNFCVRWRRKLADGTYQALQYSYRTGKMTLLDDDNGIRYARTAYADTEPRQVPSLYSIDESGAAFEVNYQGLEHPYDDLTVQDVLDDTYTIQHAKIIKAGAFGVVMTGDVVRFRSDTPSVDGVGRVITEATDKYIAFDSVPDLAIGDEFIIGAVRFRYRPAPLAGGSKTSVKTLEQLSVRALPGDRNTAGPWPKLPDGKITTRAYAAFDNSPEAEKVGEIPIFRDNEPALTSQDRFSALESNGTAIEVELENIDTRTDFTLESIEAVVREESDQIADAQSDD